MEASDVVAIVSAAMAAVAIGIGLFHESQRRKDLRQHREQDLALAAEARVRAHVLELLVTSDTGGLRTVEALHGDAHLSDRLMYLRRTATQLEVVGEASLAAGLRALCDEWANEGETNLSLQRRSEFVELVKARLRPSM